MFTNIMLYFYCTNSIPIKLYLNGPNMRRRELFRPDGAGGLEKIGPCAPLLDPIYLNRILRTTIY